VIIKGKKNDPLRKLLQANQNKIFLKNSANERIIRILDRVDLDKPILMHDKLDIIWDKKAAKP
jgi:hypothetical protein